MHERARQSVSLVTTLSSRLDTIIDALPDLTPAEETAAMERLSEASNRNEVCSEFSRRCAWCIHLDGQEAARRLDEVLASADKLLISSRRAQMAVAKVSVPDLKVTFASKSDSEPDV